MLCARGTGWQPGVAPGRCRTWIDRMHLRRLAEFFRGPRLLGAFPAGGLTALSSGANPGVVLSGVAARFHARLMDPRHIRALVPPMRDNLVVAAAPTVARHKKECPASFAPAHRLPSGLPEAARKDWRETSRPQGILRPWTAARDSRAPCRSPPLRAQRLYCRPGTRVPAHPARRSTPSKPRVSMELYFQPKELK